MGIRAQYIPLAVDNAYIRITNLWGSNEEGWNGWAEVYNPSNLTRCIDKFHVQASYVQGDLPIQSLYASCYQLDFLKNIKVDQPEDEAKNETVADVAELNLPVPDVVPDVEVQPKPKAKRTKKVK